MAETETRPRRWQFFSRWDRDETLVRLETETSRPRPQPCQPAPELPRPSVVGYRVPHFLVQSYRAFSPLTPVRLEQMWTTSEKAHNLFIEFMIRQNNVCIFNYVVSLRCRTGRIDRHQPQLALLIYEFLAGAQSRDQPLCRLIGQLSRSLWSATWQLNQLSPKNGRCLPGGRTYLTRQWNAWTAIDATTNLIDK